MAFSINSKELLNIGTINNIELVSSSARVTSAKSQQSSWTEVCTPGPIDRTPETPGSGKKVDGVSREKSSNLGWQTLKLSDFERLVIFVDIICNRNEEKHMSLEQT